jgi:hypothetical protein
MEVVPCFCCVFGAAMIAGFLAFYPLFLDKFRKKAEPPPKPPVT